MKTMLYPITISLIFISTSLYADQPLPEWLEKQIASYAQTAERDQPLSVWKLWHHSKQVYYIVSPCCDQYNYLYDENGTMLCAPTGGITGSGDGKCPRPADNDKPIELVWKKNTNQTEYQPDLYKH